MAPRPETDFRYGGQAHITRPANTVDDATWAAYLFLRDNPRGRHTERWRHLFGCGRFFNCVRDTVTDRIEASYRPGEVPPP